MELALFLATAIEKLRQANVDNPALDARLLAGHALALDRAQMLSQSKRRLSDEERARIDALIARRINGESVARILGKREFWGLDFGLNEATLEPRPDSETLVDAVLKTWPLSRTAGEGAERSEAGERMVAAENDKLTFLKATIPSPSRFAGPSLSRNAGEGFSPRILDLGTGTGCLLLALLHEIPEATGLGIDIDPRAVEQASENAAVLGLSTRVKFQTGNWLDGLTEKFDIVVSNPPYIPASDIPRLQREVRDYDPRLALDGGEDGLEPYRKLIPQLARFLNPRGFVAFEVGQGQAQDVAELLRKNRFTDVTAHKDLGGIERCVTATRTLVL